MKIIGAGLAGLIAGNLLRHLKPELYEAQERSPDNHGALLRFRTPAVAEAVAQNFRKVRVAKGWFSYDSGGVLGTPPPIPIVNQYAHKVTGRVLPRSIMNMDSADRWVAPGNFIEVLLNRLPDDDGIRLGYPVMMADIKRWHDNGHAIISTMPMPSLMTLVGWETELEFISQAITSVRTTIEYPLVDVFQTVYYPGRERWYRASITSRTLITEYIWDDIPSLTDLDLNQLRICRDFGLPVDSENFALGSTRVRHQSSGKLAPVTDEAERRAFILAMTDQYGIYSLGRFATWRQILLDDLIQDIRLIERMITERDRYSRHLGRTASP